MGKDNFLLPKRKSDSWNLLTDEEAGKVIKAIIKYVDSGEISEFDDRTLTLIYKEHINYINSNEEKYIKRCEQNAENARRRTSD